MAKVSSIDFLWLIDQLDQIENGGEPVLIQGFTNFEIRQTWNTGCHGVGCDLVMENRRDGILISVKPFKTSKKVRVSYIGVLTLVSVLVVLGVCFG